MQSNARFQLLAFAGILAVFALAYGMDRWMSMITAGVMQGTFSTYAVLWNWPLMNLLLALVVLALFALLMPRMAPRMLVITLLLGVAVAFIPLLYFTPFGARFSFLARFLSERGYMISAGAWIAVAALLALFRRRGEDSPHTGTAR